jgi:hypothetical protein
MKQSKKNLRKIKTQKRVYNQITSVLNAIAPTWRANNGVYKLHSIKDSHLQNIMRWLYNKIQPDVKLNLNSFEVNGKKATEWLKLFQLELARRRLLDYIEYNELNRLDAIVNSLIAELPVSKIDKCCNEVDNSPSMADMMTDDYPFQY